MEIVKMILSGVMGLVGGYMMYRGKKVQSVKMIVWGGILIVLSYFLFSGSGSDDTSKDVLKNIMSATPGAQQLP